MGEVERRSSDGRALPRAALTAWTIVGFAAVAVLLGVVVARLSLVVVPIVLALFPAALLIPPVSWLRARGTPNGVAAAIVLVAAVLIVTGTLWGIGQRVASQLEGVAESLEEGYNQVEAFLERGPFGLPSVQVRDVVSRVAQRLRDSGGGGGEAALRAARAAVDFVAGFALGLVLLFFYLKDGDRLSRGIRDTLPARFRPVAQGAAVRAWSALGDYLRALVLIALIDAVLIGVGLVLLGVPLALPLAVAVFLGGLLPIVGAFLSGIVAVLVALATNGVGTAALVLALIVGVQQFEGNVLEPVVMGRAVELHPVVVLVSLAAGAALLGILGAFLAVPVAAITARVVAYLREEGVSAS